nr:ubiquitin thioesterase OTUB1-like [Nyctereutes procyonoides]
MTTMNNSNNKTSNEDALEKGVPENKTPDLIQGQACSSGRCCSVSRSAGPASPEIRQHRAQGPQRAPLQVSQGFTEFTIEDFHNTFMDLIEQVEKQTSVADLLASFNDQSTSDYLVVYLRLLTSSYLQRESKFFEHFIEGGRTVKEFCQQEVEPMCKESDHIHIIALAQALSVSIQVEYMDRGEGGTTNPHIFPEGSEPKVYLLYRPGHYDILYK